MSFLEFTFQDLPHFIGIVLLIFLGGTIATNCLVALRGIFK